MHAFQTLLFLTAPMLALAGYFTQTCTEYKLGGRGGHTLSGHCYSKNQTLIASSLDLDTAIGAAKHVLIWKKNGHYSRVCHECSIVPVVQVDDYYQSSYPALGCDCGGKNTTTLVLDAEISNIDGYLTFDNMYLSTEEKREERRKVQTII